MLEVLQSIVEAASNAATAAGALELIVQRVRAALGVDQCSIYLVDPGDGALVLTASEGLAPGSIGQVRLPVGSGLVGTIGAERRPLRVEDALGDPRNVYFPITGEERFRAFLGAPLIHLSELVGVITFQTVGSRHFTNQEEAFAVTVAAHLAGIAHGAARQMTLLGSSSNLERILDGIPAAPGVSVGVPLPPSEAAHLEQVGEREVEDIEAETLAFHQALRDVIAEFREGAERYRHLDAGFASEMFETYAEIARDPSLVAGVEARIDTGQWAAGALRDAIGELVRQFETITDERLRSRAEDIRAVGRRLLLALHAETRREDELPDRCILIGPEVSIARMASVPTGRLAGIVSGGGSLYSHAAIFARSLGIPAVMGLGPVAAELCDCTCIAVDGYRGQVILEPAGTTLAHYQRLEAEERELAEEAERHADEPATTRDGRRWSVTATISNPTETSAIHGADGIGLFRTEFSFMTRESFPTEDEQVEIYRRVFNDAGSAPVVVRTLDIGGDKHLPYFSIAEANPALGTRGIRVSLRRPELFTTQIRALLRAADAGSDLRILLPMVTTLDEVIEARGLIREAHRQLVQQGHAGAPPVVGVMIEVPALAYQIDSLCQHADFLSIGSNDFAQYLLAIDRTNPSLADNFDQLQPALLIAFGNIVEHARSHGRAVSICGELGADPMGVIMALGMGSDAVSVPPRLIGRVKWVAGNFTREEATQLFRDACKLPSARAVRERLAAALEGRGLAGLIRAGR